MEKERIIEIACLITERDLKIVAKVQFSLSILSKNELIFVPSNLQLILLLDINKLGMQKLFKSL